MLDPVDRRRFLEQAAAAIALGAAGSLALGAGGSRALADDRPQRGKPTVADLMTHVDPLVRPVNANISDAENALPLLLMAGRQIPDVPEGDYHLEWCFSADQPDAERDRKIAELLDTKLLPVALVVQAAGRGKLAFSPSWLQANRWNERKGLSYMSHLLRLSIQRLISQAKLSEAADLGRSMAEAFRLLAGGGAAAIDYEFAAGCQDDAWKLMARIAAHPASNAKLVRGLLTGLPDRVDPIDHLRRAIPADFCYFDVPLLAKADGAGPVRVLEILCQWHEPTSSAVVAAKYRRWAKGIGQMLQDHPRPYDPIDTVKRTSAKWARCLADLQIPWTRLVKVPALEELKTWPEELKYPPLKHPMIDRAPASKQSIEIAHAALRQVENPVGKIYVELLEEFSDSYQRTARFFQARLEWTRLLLALHVFVLERVKLPADLDDLIAANILETMPLDPFSRDAAQPFQYSAEKKSIWSVGPAPGQGSPYGLSDGRYRWERHDFFPSLPEQNSER